LRQLAFIVLILAIISTVPCAMAETPPPEETVQSYLHALNNKMPAEAATYVYFNREKMQFGYSPQFISIQLMNWEKDWREKLGTDKVSFTTPEFLDRKLSDDGMQAVVGVSYDIVSTVDPDNPNKVIHRTEYYRLEYIGGWKIIKMGDNPMELLPTDELPEPPIESVGISPIDMMADSAVYLVPIAILMAIVGLRMNSAEKRKRGGFSKKKDRSSAAFILPPEKTSKFVKISAQPTYQVGKPAQLVVWIKNFTSVPYTNVEATASFPKGIALNTAVLKFGTIPPGKVAKRAWVITLKGSGVLVVAEPVVMFEYKGKRGIAMLEPIKLRAK